MVLSRFQGVVGVITPQNEVVSNNSKTLTLMIDELRKRGLLAVLMHRSYNAEQAEAMKGKGDTSIIADMVIDEGMNAKAMQEALAQAETLAKERKHILLVVKATPGSLQALSQWEPTLKQKNIQLAPASASVKLGS